MDIRTWKGYKVEVRKIEGETAFIHLVPDGENLNLYTNTVTVPLAELDPRTDAQRDLDLWQADTEATRESDYPG